MKKVVWAAAWMLAVLLVVNGVSFGQQEEKASPQEEKVSPEAVKKQTEQALDTAKKYTLQQKEEYQKKVEAELNDLSNRIAQLKDKAAGLKGDALKALETHTADLKDKQKIAQDKLKQFEASSAQAWQDLKAGVENSLKDLKKAYESIVEELK